jgi:hypothetical protein
LAPADSSRDRWADFPFLQAEVELTETAVETGRNGRGHLVLRNVGKEVIDLQTDSLVRAVVLYPSFESAARFTDAVLATGRIVHLTTGEEATISVIFSTTTEENGKRAALAPGEYLVKVDLPIFERRSEGHGMERSHLEMPLVGLRLVEQT